MILSSETINYLTADMKVHDVDFFLPEVITHENRYAYIDDLQMNEKMNDHCKAAKALQKAEETKLDKSPGIIMIVNAEDLSGNLRSFQDVDSKVQDALKKEGLRVLASSSSASGLSGVIVAQEGYVVTRVWPSRSYCALDIHLWSKFESQAAIRDSIVYALGGISDGKQTSSYRIVAGGIWKSEQESKVSSLDEACATQDEEAGVVTSLDDIVKDAVHQNADVPAVSSHDFMRQLLKDSVESLTKSDGTFVLLCGQQCTGTLAEDLAGMDHVRKLDVLHACSEMIGENRPVAMVEDEFSDIMFQCEQQLWRNLNDITSQGKIHSIVIDNHTPTPMAQILLRLLSSAQNVNSWMEEQFVLFTPLGEHEADDSASTWQISFLDAVKRDVFPNNEVHEYMYVGTVMLGRTGEKFGGLGMFSKGPVDFVNRLADIKNKLEENDGVEATINRIRAAFPWFQKDWYPRVFSKASDYATDDAREQWATQRSLGIQNILQFELNPPPMPDPVEEDFDEEYRLQSQAQAKQTIADSGPLTTNKIKLALFTTISSLIEQDVLRKDKTDWFEHTLGEGYLVAAFWEGGNALALWDGAKHVDLNLFTLDESIEFADKFEQMFGGHAGIVRTLRDQQPRGTGRVVNLAQQYSGYEPHWV